mmetsp:Transcript_5765/g.4953  ORF Transcript_5765/g.4953 Transcript_5765/m.4953 type:complete len:196 (+) Transcript_5765:63-650(+)
MKSRFKSPLLKVAKPISVDKPLRRNYIRKESNSSVSSKSDIQREHIIPSKNDRKSKFLKISRNNAFIPATMQIGSRNDIKSRINSIALNEGLEELENKVLLSPQIHKWKSLKISKIKTVRQPYRLKYPNNHYSTRKTLKVINFQAVDEKKQKIMLSSKSHNIFPNINHLKKMKRSLDHTLNESKDNLDRSSLQEI